MKTSTQLRAAFAAFVFATALAACGGGGGSSPAPVPSAPPTATPAPTVAPRSVMAAVTDARGTTVSSFGRHTLAAGATSVYALQGYDPEAGPGTNVINGTAVVWVASGASPVPEPTPTVSSSPSSQYQYITGQNLSGYPDSTSIQLNAPTGTSSVTATYQDPVVGKISGSVPVYTYDGARLACFVASNIPTRAGIDYESTTDILAPTDPAHADVYVSGPECTQYHTAFDNGATVLTINFPHGAIDVTAGLADFHGLLTSTATGTSITSVLASSAVRHTYLVTRRDGGKAAVYAAGQGSTGDVLILAKKADVTGAFAF